MTMNTPDTDNDDATRISERRIRLLSRALHRAATIQAQSDPFGAAADATPVTITPLLVQQLRTTLLTLCEVAIRSNDVETIDALLGLSFDPLPAHLQRVTTRSDKRMADYKFRVGSNVNDHDHGSNVYDDQEENTMSNNDHDCTPPDPYQAALVALRACEPFRAESAEAKFARQYQRQQTLAIGQARLDQDSVATMKALAQHRRDLARELPNYAPPNPYKAALEKGEGR